MAPHTSPAHVACRDSAPAPIDGEPSEAEGARLAGLRQILDREDRVLEIGCGSEGVSVPLCRDGAAATWVAYDAAPETAARIRALHETRNGGTWFELHVARVVPGDDPAPVAVPAPIPELGLKSLLAAHRPDVLILHCGGDEPALLEDVDLEKLRGIVVTFHPKLYGAKALRRAKARLEQAGFRKLPGACRRTLWVCTYDDTLNQPVPTSGWSSSVERVRDALVLPPAQTDFVQAAGVLRSDGSYVAAGALWRNGRALTTKPEAPDPAITPERLEGRWLWGGLLWRHFGHFMVESTGRLWALDAVDGQLDGILYAPKRPRHAGDVMGYQQEFLRLLDCDLPIRSIGNPTQVDELVVPGQGFGLGPLIRGTEAFRRSIAQRFGRDITAEGPEKLYISRSRLGAGTGNLLGETRLEEALAREGYEVFHPQDHDLATQIAHYKAARQIVAAEGSALHLLAMVARPDQRVAIVVRRPSSATRQIEAHLRSFAGITPATLCHLLRSWKPEGVARSRLWMGELDLPALQEALAAEGFIGKNGPRWQSLSPEEVAGILGEGYEQVD